LSDFDTVDRYEKMWTLDRYQRYGRLWYYTHRRTWLDRIA